MFKKFKKQIERNDKRIKLGLSEKACIDCVVIGYILCQEGCSKKEAVEYFKSRVGFGIRESKERQ